MYKSSRDEPETRFELRNDVLHIDFDPRTSDTMYNYIWVRHPSLKSWERVHNFGIDVGAPSSADGSEINCIGMNLVLQREKDAVRVTYPTPLVQYRQFDDKVGDAGVIRRYPDIPAAETPSLVHSDASLEFVYEVDAARPFYVVKGKVLGGRVFRTVYIVSALWTDNHALPTHVYYEGFPEYDVFHPEAAFTRTPQIENVAYVIFYRADGNGVPFALLPLDPAKTVVCNYYDNWKCLADFRLSCLNQQYVPENPAVSGCNDSGYHAVPRGDGTLAGVCVVFFPEFGWRQGGLGRDLRNRIENLVTSEYCDAAKSWLRRENNLAPALTISGPAAF
ncbi:MAG TPA: hypothetical protein ENN09_04450 [Planctomycetes bacterium]|nr:hypothetical protein [Planctomycetota bacterium]